MTFIFQTRPDLLGENAASAKGSRGWVVAGVLVSLVVLFLSSFASAYPDGLNRVATDLGFINMARTGARPLAGDTVPFFESISLSKIVAGGIGLAVGGVIILLLGQCMKAKS